MRTRLFVAAGVLVALLLLPVVWLRGGLFQEPLGTASAAAIVEVSGGWRAVGEQNEYLLKSSNMDSFLQAQEGNGWEYVEQMGSGHLFGRDGDTRVLVCRLYSTRFQICPMLDRS